MIYTPKGDGVCKECGIKLPVPSWSFCMLHDSTKNRTVVKPFVELNHKTKNRPEKYGRSYLYYLGYDIQIPLDKFEDADLLLVDDSTREIIGWR